MGVHVSSMGVHETTRREHVTVPVGHGFDGPVGAVEIHGDVHVAHIRGHEIRRVGLTLSRMEGQGGGRWWERRILHYNIEGLVLTPQSQASTLGGGHRWFETDRPARQDHVVSLATPRTPSPAPPTSCTSILGGVGGSGRSSPAQATLGAQVNWGAAALLSLLPLLIHIHLLLYRGLAELVEAAEGWNLMENQVCVSYLLVLWATDI